MDFFNHFRDLVYSLVEEFRVYLAHIVLCMALENMIWNLFGMKF